MVIKVAMGNHANIEDYFNTRDLYNKFVKVKLQERESDPKKGLSVNTIYVYLHHYRHFAMHIRATLHPMSERVGRRIPRIQQNLT